MAEEEIYFEDAMSQMGYGEAVDFKQLVIQQMGRINANASLEMRGGYYEKVAKKEGLIMRYVPDARQVFIESVKTLLNLIECKFKDDEKENEETQTLVEKEVQEWKEELKQYEIQFKNELQGQGQKEIETIKQEHWNKLCEHYRKLFTILSGFCSRQDYFGEIRGRAR